VRDNCLYVQNSTVRQNSREFDFEHVIPSPGHAQATGKAESAVKSAKITLKKAEEAGYDPYLALLEAQNTPLQNIGSSPVQLLMSDRTTDTERRRPLFH